MSRSLPAVVAVVLVALLFPRSACAAGKKTVEALVMSLTAETITVKSGANQGYKVVDLQLDGSGKQKQAANIDTYKVRPETVITLNGLPVGLKELKPGMKVNVTQTLDPTVAWSIVAVTLPPKQAVNATDKLPPVKGKGPRKLGQGVDAYKVQSFGPDIITVAQDGGKKSIAYRVNRFTEVSVNNERGALSKLKVGMKVSVAASTDPTIAARIVARDGD